MMVSAAVFSASAVSAGVFSAAVSAFDFASTQRVAAAFPEADVSLLQ